MAISVLSASHRKLRGRLIPSKGTFGDRARHFRIVSLPSNDYHSYTDHVINLCVSH